MSRDGAPTEIRTQRLWGLNPPALPFAYQGKATRGLQLACGRWKGTGVNPLHKSRLMFEHQLRTEEFPVYENHRKYSTISIEASRYLQKPRIGYRRF